MHALPFQQSHDAAKSDLALLHSKGPRHAALNLLSVSI